MTKPAQTQHARLPVRSRIYRILYTAQGFCSRQELAARCGVSLPTLHQSLRELMAEGLVRYTGEGPSTGGRRAQGLDIVPELRYSVGIALNKRELRLVAADLRLQELAFRSVRFDVGACLAGREPKLAAHLEAFLDGAGLDRSRLLGVSVTVPGLVSEDQKTLLVAPTLEMKNVPLSQLLGAIPYPVNVDNDGSASGYAEYFLRRMTGSMAYLSLENGVGGAIVLGGTPYFGDHRRSGEFGHICVEPGGLRCTCGKYGCLETYCTPQRIKAAFGVSTEEFFRGVEAHKPEYTALLYDMLRHLAIAINSIRMTLDCDVVIGGFMSEYLVPYLPILREYVLSGNPFEENADFVQFSSLRRHITPLGAALFFIQEFVSGI